MGIAPRRGALSIGREVEAPAENAWRLLVDVARWPQWGPSVRRAVLADGATELALGVRGTVWTAVGMPLPFVITAFESGRRWDWAVAGVPATGHRVQAAPDGCRVIFDVPWWAAPYLTVCAVALARIEMLAKACGDPGSGDQGP